MMNGQENVKFKNIMLDSPSSMTIRRRLSSTACILWSIYKHYVGQSPLC